MGITYGDHLIDSGYYDITPEQEREIWAREECARRGIDPDELCADGGVEAWMIVAKEAFGSPPADHKPFDGLGEPRRCDTGLVGPYGQCCACNAAMGEHCRDCPICHADCAGANPPIYNCPMLTSPLTVPRRTGNG